FLNDNKMADRVDDFTWEFNVVEDEAVNAWCMPGGKIVFYSGILPVTEGLNGIATVMGHEIAHAVAQHGNERMTQQLAIYLGAVSLDYALANEPEKTRDIFLMAYGAGSQLGSLAYSRTHEYEADKLGMVFMAMSGYDPAYAIDFWQRMSQIGGGKPPEFLSTHPSDENRVKALQKFLPEAKKYYTKNEKSGGSIKL
ncbi:MAG: M48 family metallopeptidase, partial [Bacteroidales bacterium]|nr:M48 family metallopeptidase [Bacteroidales bacterium]